MGWLRWVGWLELQDSFAEYSLFYTALWQKRPIILRSLRTVATPYQRISQVHVRQAVGDFNSSRCARIWTTQREDFNTHNIHMCKYTKTMHAYAQVSFAQYSLFYRALLQKRPIMSAASTLITLCDAFISWIHIRSISHCLTHSYHNVIRRVNATHIAQICAIYSQRRWDLKHLDGFPVHSFEWRALPCTSVKTCLKIWGLPWKLVGYFGSRNCFESDLLCRWTCTCRALRHSLRSRWIRQCAKWAFIHITFTLCDAFISCAYIRSISHCLTHSYHNVIRRVHAADTSDNAMYVYMYIYIFIYIYMHVHAHAERLRHSLRSRCTSAKWAFTYMKNAWYLHIIQIYIRSISHVCNVLCACVMRVNIAYLYIHMNAAYMCI